MLELDWTIIYLVTYYWMWRWRNGLIFYPKNPSLTLIAKSEFIKKYVVEFFDARAKVALPCTLSM